jgi:hypothetical protein
MRPKSMTLLAGMVVLTIILFMDYQPVVAASPTGEVKTAVPEFGYENTIPRLDGPQANDWMLLLYDPLIGITPDGKFSEKLGLAN